MNNSLFKDRVSVEQVEESNDLAPSFGDQGLIPVVTTDVHSGDVLMVGYMNKDAFALTIETKKAHYWSRSRKKIWKKGETSGLNQAIKKILIDDDQDCLIFRVELGGLAASCHVGYKSCFYRSLKGKNELIFTETEKVFDPEEVYEGQDNPTIL